MSVFLLFLFVFPVSRLHPAAVRLFLLVLWIPQDCMPSRSIFLLYAVSPLLFSRFIWDTLSPAALRSSMPPAAFCSTSAFFLG